MTFCICHDPASDPVPDPVPDPVSDPVPDPLPFLGLFSIDEALFDIPRMIE